MLALAHTPRALEHYDWQVDDADARDAFYVAKGQTIWHMPYEVDFSAKFPAVAASHRLGNCTLASLGEAIAFAHIQGQNIKEEYTYNRFHMLKEKVCNQLKEAGSPKQLRSAIKAYKHNSSLSWSQLTAHSQPQTGNTFAKQLNHEKAFSYFRIAQKLEHLKACLSEGHPFVFGFSVFEAFENADLATKGELKMPNSHNTLLGGHTALCVGYNDHSKRFLIRNSSWGPHWGIKGHLNLPYAYLEKPELAGDFWTLRTV